MGAHRVPDWAVAQRQVLEEPRGPDSRSPSDAAEAMRTHVSPRGAVLLDLTFITVTMETARARVTNWLHYPLVDAPLPGDLDAIPCQPPAFSQTAFIRELAELESRNLALAAPPPSDHNLLLFLPRPRATTAQPFLISSRHQWSWPSPQEWWFDRPGPPGLLAQARHPEKQPPGGTSATQLSLSPDGLAGVVTPLTDDVTPPLAPILCSIWTPEAGESRRLELRLCLKKEAAQRSLRSWGRNKQELCPAAPTPSQGILAVAMLAQLHRPRASAGTRKCLVLPPGPRGGSNGLGPQSPGCAARGVSPGPQPPQHTRLTRAAVGMGTVRRGHGGGGSSCRRPRGPAGGDPGSPRRGTPR
nr:uncharacterized protein LOC111772477 isoform X2 [Equus caballus]